MPIGSPKANQQRVVRRVTSVGECEVREKGIDVTQNIGSGGGGTEPLILPAGVKDHRQQFPTSANVAGFNRYAVEKRLLEGSAHLTSISTFRVLDVACVNGKRAAGRLKGWVKGCSRRIQGHNPEARAAVEASVDQWWVGRREWRRPVEEQLRDGADREMVIEKSYPCACHRLPVPKQVPGDAGAWREVVPVLVGDTAVAIGVTGPGQEEGRAPGTPP